MKSFIENNHRNLLQKKSLMVHILKRGQKLMNAGELKELRLGMFMELRKLIEQYNISDNEQISSLRAR